MWWSLLVDDCLWKDPPLKFALGWDVCLSRSWLREGSMLPGAAPVIAEALPRPINGAVML